MSSDLHRYHRQMLLPGIGEAGQERLLETHALIVGCGALGSVIVDLLARAGVGTLSIVDRDVVELTNLQRQVLFDEGDVEQGMPKAEAARARLARINSQVKVHAFAEDFSDRTWEQFVMARQPRVDIVLDGLDNFETRYLLNDVAVKRGLPLMYGGAVGTTGLSMPILPHPARREGPATSAIAWSAEQSTPCLRCLFPDAPPPGTTPTCDTAGVLATAVTRIAAHQVTQAIKLITGNIDAIDRQLLSVDVWCNSEHHFDVSGARSEAGAGCPCCVDGRFDFIEGGAGSAAATLCGRNAVQIQPARSGGMSAADSAARLDLSRIAQQLAPHGSFTHNGFLLRGAFAGERGRDGERLELTLFPDGRAIIKGTVEPEVARAVYAKYVGH